MALSVVEVEQLVAKIYEKHHDDEAAHAMEDDLHLTVLRAIAAGHENAAALAQAALKTTKFDFQRWCA